MIVVALDLDGVGVERVAVKIVAKFFAGATKFFKFGVVLFLLKRGDSKIKKFQGAIKTIYETIRFILILE